MLMLMWRDLAADNSTLFPVGAQHVLLKTSGRESSRRFVPNQLLCQACPLEADSVFLLRFFIFNRTQKWSRLGLLQEEQWELPKSGQKTARWVAKHSPEKLLRIWGRSFFLQRRRWPYSSWRPFSGPMWTRVQQPKSAKTQAYVKSR